MLLAVDSPRRVAPLTPAPAPAPAPPAAVPAPRPPPAPLIARRPSSIFNRYVPAPSAGAGSAAKAAAPSARAPTVVQPGGTPGPKYLSAALSPVGRRLQLDPLPGPGSDQWLQERPLGQPPVIAPQQAPYPGLPALTQPNSLLERWLKPTMPGIVNALSTTNWADVDKLNSKGDKLVSRTFLDVELGVDPMAVRGKKAAAGQAGSNTGTEVSGKAQVARQTEVIRDSDAPNSTFTVRSTAMHQVGLAGEASVSSDPLKNLSKLPVINRLPPAFSSTAKAYLRAGGNVGVSNVVEMRFNSAAEARKAAETLDKLHAAETMDTALRTSSSKLPVIGDTYGGAPVKELANPLSEYGEIHPAVRRAAGVSDADLKGLNDAKVAQEFSVMASRNAAGEGRVTLDAKYPEGKVPALDTLLKNSSAKAGGGIVGSVTDQVSFTRRVEYPSATADGHVVDRINAYSQVLGKDRAVQSVGVGPEQLGFTGSHRGDDNYEILMSGTSIEYASSVPKGTLVDGGKLLTQGPDHSGTAKVTAWTMKPTREEWPGLASKLLPGSDATSAPNDTQQVDMDRSHFVYEASPAQVATIATGFVVAGGWSGTLLQGKGCVISQGQGTVQREGGSHTQTWRGGVLDAVAVEGSLTRYSGFEDYPKVDHSQPVPNQCQAASPQPPGPVDDRDRREVPRSTHWQVQPAEGAKLRSTPSVSPDNLVGVVSSGSFLNGQGATKVDAERKTWVKVSGFDRSDQPVAGWVRSDMLKPFDKDVGDNDAAGRIKPQREQTGQAKRIVVQDDNLWHLAHDYQQDFEQLLAANPHLLDPNLVFAGDSVYLPQP